MKDAMEVKRNLRTAFDEMILRLQAARDAIDTPELDGGSTDGGGVTGGGGLTGGDLPEDLPTEPVDTPET